MDKINLSKNSLEPIQGHTSKGDQPKWLKNNFWYKADYMGYETLSEVLIAELLAQSNIREYVAYSPVLIQFDHKEVIGCKSANFRKSYEKLVPLEKLHRAYFGNGLSEKIASFYDPMDKIKYTVDFVEKITGLKNVGPYITMILELDAFFLNEDRHTNNLAVLRNENTKAFRLCPIFDNGLALLSDINDYPISDDIYGLISRVEAKPFDTSFNQQMEAAEELYGSQLEFYFSKNDILAKLKEFGEFYDETIMNRVENILLEQMRKYSAFFKREKD